MGGCCTLADGQRSKEIPMAMKERSKPARTPERSSETETSFTTKVSNLFSGPLAFVFTLATLSPL
jgi:hypothetical protein